MNQLKEPFIKQKRSVAIEGGEGVGKSTLINNLAKRLEADKITNVLITKEPGGCVMNASIREQIKEYANKTKDLFSQESLSHLTALFAKDRTINYEFNVRPFLEADDRNLVVTDRSFYSSLIIQGVIPGSLVVPEKGNEMVNSNRVITVNAAEGLVCLPGTIFLITGSAETSNKRMVERKSTGKADTIDGFDDLLTNERYLDSYYFNEVMKDSSIVINGEQSEEKVFADFYKQFSTLYT